MIKMLLAACGGACLAFAAPANAQAVIVHHDSFTIHAAGDAAQAQAMAQDLARYDATLRQIFSVDAQAPKNPLDVYLVAKSKDAGRLATGQSGSDVAGWYSRHAEGSFVIASQDGWAAERKSIARSVLFHEYAHHFLNRYDEEAMPSWLSEGSAEYYATMTFDANGHATIGQFPEIRARSMARKNQLPIETLLFSSPMQIADKVQREQFYNRAWLMVHMANSRPEWRAKLAQYRAALRGGTDLRTAATSSFGDLKALNAALDAYAAGPIASHVVSRDDARTGSVRVTSLTGARGHVVALQMERKAAGQNAERLALVHQKATDVAARYSDDADVQWELAKVIDALRKARKNRGQGIAELRLQGETALNRSLALRGDHGAANLLGGQAAMDELRFQGSTDASAWQNVRSQIRMAMQRDSDNPMALKAYYDSFIGERRPASTEALQAIAKAYALAPELPSVRTTYAWSLARSGDLDGAERVMQKLTLDPQDGGSAAMVAVQFAGMRKLQASAGAAAERRAAA